MYNPSIFFPPLNSHFPHNRFTRPPIYPPYLLKNPLHEPKNGLKTQAIILPIFKRFKAFLYMLLFSFCGLTCLCENFSSYYIWILIYHIPQSIRLQAAAISSPYPGIIRSSYSTRKFLSMGISIQM